MINSPYLSEYWKTCAAAALSATTIYCSISSINGADGVDKTYHITVKKCGLDLKERA